MVVNNQLRALHQGEGLVEFLGIVVEIPKEFHQRLSLVVILQSVKVLYLHYGSPIHQLWQLLLVVPDVPL